MSELKVLIGLPTYNDQVHVNFAMALVNATRALSDAGVKFQMMHVSSSLIARARNLFANYVLEHAEFTHLLFLDTDMYFLADAITKLLAANRDVAGVAYPYRQINLNRRIESDDKGLSLREWLEKHADYTVRVKGDPRGRAQVVDGLVEAEHVGTGIMLIRRDVLEKTIPFAQCFLPPEQYLTLISSGRFYGLFDTFDDNGAYLSEDLSFCRRARLAGCTIWALVDQTVVHYGASEVAGQYLRALQLRGNFA
ncbi:glycosyltransferase family 2 protein [Paraburkholderia sp. DHOC27]|uniref:glycosyltransferase family 2 protein n=1 Tax=Paraburkholderia sp. DHOC27 TaxID=2303330 RepID=UPI000E3BE418|nr:hypothetical protein [Paraburkholderia sp. DHOC27]RFU48335.1 hypothetical protein D0B32_00340 [Paraburkholderia sp. DHOC27]